METTTDREKHIEPLLNAQRVAAILQVAPRTVRRYAREGCIPRPVRIAGSVRWRKSDILTFIESNCVLPKAPRRDA